MPGAVSGSFLPLPPAGLMGSPAPSNNPFAQSAGGAAPAPVYTSPPKPAQSQV